jgi:uncharacterized membrane protein
MVEARVDRIEHVERREDEGGVSNLQTFRATLLNGPHSGEQKTVTQDYITVSEGDRVFLSHYLDISGVEMYSLIDIDRRMAMYACILLFVLLVIFFGGWQGVRSLIALSISFVALIYILIPLLLAGYQPVMIGTVVASVILFAAIFLTYGFTATSVIAFVGTTLAVGFTGLFAWTATVATHLSGMASEESVYLQYAGSAPLDMIGILIAGIIIGALGVLDDIAVTQVAVVKELLRANGTLSARALYTRAIRVGQSHVSALVNTLMLAYTGASLPLLLLFSQSFNTTLYVPPINMELFATEIIRMIVGSSGLILAVPITTALAVWYGTRYREVFVREETHEHGHHH